MAYWLARVFAVTGLLAPSIFLLALFAADYLPSPGKTWAFPTQASAVVVAAISLILIFVSAIGSALTILLGWSAERRKRDEISN